MLLGTFNSVNIILGLIKSKIFNHNESKKKKTFIWPNARQIFFFYNLFSARQMLDKYFSFTICLGLKTVFLCYRSLENWFACFNKIFSIDYRKSIDRDAFVLYSTSLSTFIINISFDIFIVRCVIITQGGVSCLLTIIELNKLMS